MIISYLHHFHWISLHLICRKEQLTGFFITGTMVDNELTQLTFICLKLTIEALEKCVKYVQS